MSRRRTWVAIFVVVAAGALAVAVPSAGVAVRDTASPHGRIIYRCAAGICSVSLATGAARTLFRAGPGARDFVWSRDGRRLAYTDAGRPFTASDPRLHTSVIVLVDPSGRRRVLTAGYEPQWSPDGDRILYRHETASIPRTHLYVIRAAGGKPQRLARAVSGAWSRRNEIAYSNGYGVWVVSGSGGRPRLLVPRHRVAPAREWMAVGRILWSPDGRTLGILTISTRGGTAAEADRGQLVLASPEGRLRVFPVPAHEATWSPDGHRVAIDASTIWVYARNARRVSRYGGRWLGTSPLFSPDSEWVAYTEHDSATGEERLAIRRPDGSSRQVARGARGLVYRGTLFRWLSS